MTYYTIYKNDYDRPQFEQPIAKTTNKDKADETLKRLMDENIDPYRSFRLEAKRLNILSDSEMDKLKAN